MRSFDDWEGGIGPTVEFCSKNNFLLDEINSLQGHSSPISFIRNRETFRRIIKYTYLLLQSNDPLIFEDIIYLISSLH